jgi:hypothetical protein
MIPGQAPANVRFAPNSGHKWVLRRMSAFDPKRTLARICLMPAISKLVTKAQAVDYCV